MEIICVILNLYVLVLFARAILSFFPLTPGGAMYQIASALATVTEPVLAPVRKVIPPLGMFDLSFIVVLIGIQILVGVICPGGGLF